MNWTRPFPADAKQCAGSSETSRTTTDGRSRLKNRRPTLRCAGRRLPARTRRTSPTDESTIDACLAVMSLTVRAAPSQMFRGCAAPAVAPTFLKTGDFVGHRMPVRQRRLMHAAVDDRVVLPARRFEPSTAPVRMRFPRSAAMLRPSSRTMSPWEGKPVQQRCKLRQRVIVLRAASPFLVLVEVLDGRPGAVFDLVQLHRAGELPLRPSMRCSLLDALSSFFAATFAACPSSTGYPGC